MDPEVWKMAATSFKTVNHQKGMFAPKMLQVNRGKYIPTERVVKKPTNVALSEESGKVEDKVLHANGKANSANEFRFSEQGEIINVCVRQRKTNYFKDCRKSSALTCSGGESQNMTRLPSEVENKRLPILVSDVGHTFIPQSQERRSLLFRQDGKTNCSEVKNLFSNHCSKTKSVRTNLLKKELLFQAIEDTQDTGLRHGIPLNYSNKRIILKNVPHHSATNDPCKRIKISDDMTPVRSVGKICQKMFNPHQLPHRQLPTLSSSLTYSRNSSSLTCKNMHANGMQKDKLRSSPPDEMKGGIANFKDKTEGSSTHRRLLLIDSQGLPYTVVVEEPKSIGLSNSTSTSWSDSTLAGVSKSLAPRKVYKCPVCFRIFEYLSYLQRHSIAHSQQKPHVCKVCGKAFKRTSHLTRHKYTHFGKKSCQCQTCQRRFRDVNELTHHEQSHTGEKNH